MKAILKFVWTLLFGGVIGGTVGSLVYGNVILVQNIGLRSLFIIIPFWIGVGVAVIHYGVEEWGW